MLSESNLDFVVRECGSLARAIDYCDRIAAVAGPLACEYTDGASRLRARTHAGDVRAALAQLHPGEARAVLDTIANAASRSGAKGTRPGVDGGKGDR